MDKFKFDIDEQSEKKYFILMADEVLKYSICNFFNDLQPENICSKVVVKLVLKFVKSKLIKELQS